MKTINRKYCLKFQQSLLHDRVILLLDSISSSTKVGSMPRGVPGIICSGLFSLIGPRFTSWLSLLHNCSSARFIATFPRTLFYSLHSSEPILIHRRRLVNRFSIQQSVARRHHRHLLVAASTNRWINNLYRQTILLLELVIFVHTPNQ